MDFTIPARDGWGEIVLHWNDGIMDGVEMGPKYMTGWYNRVYKREHTNFPQKLVELERKWGVKNPIPAFGTVFVGTKGMIYEEFHRTLRFFPEGGKIAEQGDHESLMKQGGFYTQLYNAQFAREQ